MLFPLGHARHPLHQDINPLLGGMRQYEQDNKTKRAYPRGVPEQLPEAINLSDLYSPAGARAELLFGLMDDDGSGSIDMDEMARYYRKASGYGQGF